MVLSRQDLLAAYPNRGEKAERLGKLIDHLGTAATRDNQLLEPEEIDRALTLTKSEDAADRVRAGTRELRGRGPHLERPPALRGQGLLSLLTEVLGESAIGRVKDAASFAAEVRAEKAGQEIDQAELVKDLQVLCKNPLYRLREAGDPSYKLAADWVGRELEKVGFAPYGDAKPDGKRSFTQAFRWEERFAPGKISKSYNVVAILKGTDPEPRRAVLLTAHLDNLSAAQRAEEHLESYEGANDNTASVVAVLAAARALARIGPLRSDVIVMIPSAEEDGLKGTEAFVSSLPESERDRFAGEVNLEMIGRNTTDQLLVFGGVDASEANQNPLFQRALRVAAEHDIELKPGHQFDDGQSWEKRSDHWITRNAGIPSVMLHGRATPESYHTESDTLEQLNLEKVRASSREAFLLARDLADDPAPAEKRKPMSGPLNHYPGKVWLGEG